MDIKNLILNEIVNKKNIVENTIENDELDEIIPPSEGENIKYNSNEAISAKFSRLIISLCKKEGLYNKNIIGSLWNDPKGTIPSIAKNIIYVIDKLRTSNEFKEYIKIKGIDEASLFYGQELLNQIEISLDRQAALVFIAYQAYQSESIQSNSKQQIQKRILNPDLSQLPTIIDRIKLRKDKVYDRYKQFFENKFLYSAHLYLDDLYNKITNEIIFISEASSGLESSFNEEEKLFDVMFKRVIPSIIKIFCILPKENIYEADSRIFTNYSFPDILFSAIKSSSPEIPVGDEVLNNVSNEDSLLNIYSLDIKNSNVRGEYFADVNFAIVLNSVINNWNSSNKYIFIHKEDYDFPVELPFFEFTNSVIENKYGENIKKLSSFTLEMITELTNILIDSFYSEADKEKIKKSILYLTKKYNVYGELFSCGNLSNYTKQNIASFLKVKTNTLNISLKNITGNENLFRNKIKKYLEINNFDINEEFINSLLNIKNNDEFMTKLMSLSSKIPSLGNVVTNFLRGSSDANEYIYPTNVGSNNPSTVSSNKKVNLKKYGEEIFSKLSVKGSIWAGFPEDKKSLPEFLFWLANISSLDLSKYIKNIQDGIGNSGKDFTILTNKTQKAILDRLYLILDNKKELMENNIPEADTSKILENALIEYCVDQIFSFASEFVPEIDYLSKFLMEYSVLSGARGAFLLRNKLISDDFARKIASEFLNKNKTSILDVTKLSKEEKEELRNKNRVENSGISYTPSSEKFTLDEE